MSRVSRPRAALVSAAAAVALIGALGGCRALAPNGPEPPPTARLYVETNAGDAAVWLDDDYVGHAAQFADGATVEAGARRLELRHDDYHNFYERLELEPDDKERVRAHLAPRLP